jgi:hypothetical protein
MTLDSNTLAALIRRDAERYIAQFNRDGTDAEFERLIARDKVALDAVADLAEKADLRGAYRRWAKLDTVVREALSQPAWRALTGGNAIGQTEHDR